MKYMPNAFAGISDYSASQRECAVGNVNDSCEHEADAIADKMISIPDQDLNQHRSVHGEEEKIQRESIVPFIQRKESGHAGIDNGVSSAGSFTKTKGDSLDASLESFMESSLDTDFSNVRIHTDNEAVQMNRALNAKAFTSGNDIYFNEGQYQPGSQPGKHLLAHELVHVKQQNSQSKPGIIQRKANKSDEIHQPIIDQFRRDHGLSEEDDVSDAYIKYMATNPSAILNNVPYTSAIYRAAVQAWPNNQSIWQILRSRQSRINFIRYILSFDETNCVRYDPRDMNYGESCSAMAQNVTSFENACQGYAAQMYARYTSTGRMSQAAVAALDTRAHVLVGNVPPKLFMPIRIVTVPGHAFNAVLIGDNPQDSNDWVFFEPQNDNVFLASDRLMRDPGYAGSGIFTIGTFTDYTTQFVPDSQNELNFLLEHANNSFNYRSLRLEERIPLQTLFRDIFIADDPTAYPFATAQHNPPFTYDQYIANSASNISLQTLALAFTYLNGRSFARALNGQRQTMNRSIFLQLANRPGLEQLIP